MIKKYAIIENDTVINLVLVDPNTSDISGWMEVNDSMSGLTIGSKYINGIFVPPVTPEVQRTIEEKWNLVRYRRNNALLESDISVLPDLWATYTPEQQQAWSQYRQALRDIPQNYTNPDDVVWPVPPSA